MKQTQEVSGNINILLHKTKLETMKRKNVVRSKYYILLYGMCVCRHGDRKNIYFAFAIATIFLLPHQIKILSNAFLILRSLSLTHTLSVHMTNKCVLLSWAKRVIPTCSKDNEHQFTAEWCVCVGVFCLC